MAKKSVVSPINALVAVDKPLHMSSHDVVANARRSLSIRRIGHAGTLDPAATGVMILGIGQATRLLGQITLDKKSYVAQISFGIQTTTDDAEGDVVLRAPVPDVLSSFDYAARFVSGLVGTSKQVPPVYSAISIDGVRAYRRARQGEKLELSPRPIEIFDAQLINISPAGAEHALTWTLALTVSKGTYIRALARDIGRNLGSAAHISALQRTASGSISLDVALSLDRLSVDTVKTHALNPLAVLNIPSFDVNEAQLIDVHVGRSLTDLSDCPVGRIGLTCAGQLHALAAYDGKHCVMETVFPQALDGCDEHRLREGR
ncbi:tRNA pseudouridine(55) synthase TruB [Collinsella sp. zg1085]|uniref:tRNA pseudouridine(55) synthase TruB n=1 Tax=Collinsella sp. zg1085 TaxID=2844380 RepID=UPI001C0BDD55|nr:tRNA pseudouridine(55) synthase TruB [Collinsella sp. zg1085]QWT16961.1 tRNA pseudouridine(55) synthase TruB [Collinsella sp. zg1085]